jgi:hypothetical protein
MGCANNINQKINNTDSSPQNHFESKKEDTVNFAKTIEVDSDSLSNYDAYEFNNDTLVQDVFVNYLKPRQIKFLIRTKNKLNKSECEYSGMAMMAQGEGTAQGSDELNNEELYGVYEYFTKGHPYFTLDIEFKRGERMTVFTKDDKGLCNVYVPLSSQGTLRRISLSKKVQHNPTW